MEKGSKDLLQSTEFTQIRFLFLLHSPHPFSPKSKTQWEFSLRRGGESWIVSESGISKDFTSPLA